MNKKKLLAVALVVIMIATISFSSLAWFTDRDSAKNNFTIGGANEDEDPDQIFSIDVKENVDGKEEAVDGMEFKDILPGDKFKKEAYITNTGSYDQYIRVTMKITDWNLIKDLIIINMDEDFNKNWWIVSPFVSVSETTGNLTAGNGSIVNPDGSLTVVMFLKHKLEPGETVNIMDYVSISALATQEDFANAAFADGFSIEIKADAAQTENILPNYARDESSNAQRTFEILDAE